MKMLVCGAFDFVNMATGGQPVKTRELYWLLCEKYGKENVMYCETLGWKRNPIKLFADIIKKAKICDAAIMLPAQNGLMIFSTVFLFLKKSLGKKIFYDVIGGWLPEKLSKEPKLAKTISQFDGIWVETETMKNRLEKLGLNNVTVIPNFKRLTPISSEELYQNGNPPFTLCTFSRVMKEKGIEDAVNAVSEANRKLGKTVYTLDIYGQIDGGQTEWFENLKATFPEYISYKGVADPSKSVEVLKDYFALLFPTRFYTEGVPGTIIDAYFSGTPVISSRWLSFKDVVKEGMTGFGYAFGEYDELFGLLEKIANEPIVINSLRNNCLNEAKKYTPQNAISILSSSLK